MLAALSPLLLAACQHPIELLVFLVLLYITLYRRDLSSNRAYRKQSTATSLPASRLRVPTLSREDLTHGIRTVSMKVSDMSGRVRDLFNSSPHGYMLQQSLSGAYAARPAPRHWPPAPHSGALQRLLSNKDLMLSVLTCLEASDISSLTTTCKGFLSLHDPVIYLLITFLELSLTGAQEFIWMQLWAQRYGLRVWRSPSISRLRTRRGIRWNPFSNWGPPSQGWKLFFMEFEFGKSDAISHY